MNAVVYSDFTHADFSYESRRYVTVARKLRTTGAKCCTLFFYKNNFIKTRGSFFAQYLRTISASAEEQSLKF